MSKVSSQYHKLLALLESKKALRPFQLLIEKAWSRCLQKDDALSRQSLMQALLDLQSASRLVLSKSEHESLVCRIVELQKALLTDQQSLEDHQANGSGQED